MLIMTIALLNTGRKSLKVQSLVACVSEKRISATEVNCIYAQLNSTNYQKGFKYWTAYAFAN